MSFEEAYEINEIVGRIIGSELVNELDENISEAKIVCLFVHKKQDALAKILKPTGAWQFLLEDKCDFVIISMFDMWQELSQHQKEAVIFHELMHAKSTVNKDGGINWKIVDHQIEEFLPVVRNFGAYRRELRDFVDALRYWEEENIPQQK